MAQRTECTICDKTFKNEEGLRMHNASKHRVEKTKTKKSSIIEKNKILIITLLIIGLAIFGIIQLIPEKEIKNLNVNLENKEIDIPSGAIHWHPKLTIDINGKLITLPDGIGSDIGRIVDIDLSGMRMSPTHTHAEVDGTIHLENSNPSKKPETTTLGYFFYIWDKQFNSECIFDYCTDNGELTLTINGKENNEYENYLMKDNDNIVIKYASN